MWIAHLLPQMHQVMALDLMDESSCVDSKEGRIFARMIRRARERDDQLPAMARHMEWQESHRVAFTIELDD